MSAAQSAPHLKSQQPLFLYMKPHCPYSRKALSHLQQSQMAEATEVMDVTGNMDLLRAWTGQRTVPQLYAQYPEGWRRQGDSQAVTEMAQAFQHFCSTSA